VEWQIGFWHGDREGQSGAGHDAEEYMRQP
jgi:hypothetical protein